MQNAEAGSAMQTFAQLLISCNHFVYCINYHDHSNFRHFNDSFVNYLICWVFLSKFLMTTYVLSVTTLSEDQMPVIFITKSLSFAFERRSQNVARLILWNVQVMPQSNEFVELYGHFSCFWSCFFELSSKISLAYTYSLAHTHTYVCTHTRTHILSLNLSFLLSFLFHESLSVSARPLFLFLSLPPFS